MSKSYVGGAYFSGRIKFLKDTGMTCSAWSHLSDMTLMKYCGGRGSKRGTVKER